MASTSHTFGPSCMLHTTSNPFTRRASQVSIDPPKISAQFFYCSALPIDDPLSPVPLPSSNPTNKSARVPPRPFSVRDNIALESAWLRLQRPAEMKYQSSKEPKDARAEHYHTGSELTPNVIQNTHKEKPVEQEKTIGTQAMNAQSSGLAMASGSPDGMRSFSMDHPGTPPDLTLSDDPKHIPFDDAMPVTSEEIGKDEFESGLRKQRSRSPFRRKDKSEKRKDKREKSREKGERDDEQDLVSRRSSRKLSRSGLQVTNEEVMAGVSPADTSGQPFLRIASRTGLSESRPQSSDRQQKAETSQADGAGAGESDHRPKQPSPLRPKFQRISSSTEDGDHSNANQDSTKKPNEAHVAVGISRLHVVEMPSLKMGPIYWDPVHDVSSVVRGTWFYKGSMCPVESDVANQLEAGYEYLKPWTPTYQDELNSCIEIGPEAELKVAHKIWPPEKPQPESSRPGTAKSRELLQPASDEKERQKALISADLAPNKAAGILAGFETTARLYERSSVIYANGRDAQILKQGLLPSAARGRKPLANIRKGRPVGIPIVRGFDVQAWEKLNPPLKKRTKAIQDPANAVRTFIGTTTQTPCVACEGAEDQPKPTDLVMVIHGIGQKLSERVEAFHFTHAINAFRRQVNMELDSEDVKPWLRQDLGGIMVLPINWRSTLKLDDDGPAPDPNHKETDPTKNQFNLKDITAESIPAVRNLISDVMLDIPYYLSHHKAKMVEAVIREANRVYRLWCINNPGFHETGKVHLMAHSLGSVMALDILSNQPTRLPHSLDFNVSKVRNDIFEFDTKNLLFCGSPAGFFLLLNQAALMPRKDREKPDAESDIAGVAGQVGTYGCLAVDNIYNVMAYNDPIAYRLNATVDVDYAASLQQAFVPSAALSWGQYFGSYFRGKAIAPTTTMTGLDSLPRRPTTVRLPTTVEMETHDFSKEEIAEQRMFLLNDNGQIDYTMQKEGGALEFQYLNMLSAHSSYWTRRDFVRFLVVEIGRTPGRTATVSSIKAVKKPYGKK